MRTFEINQERFWRISRQGKELTVSWGKLGGKVQEGLGKLTGNKDLESKGKMNQAKGGVQEGLGKAERKVSDTLDKPADNPNAI